MRDGDNPVGGWQVLRRCSGQSVVEVLPVSTTHESADGRLHVGVALWSHEQCITPMYFIL